VEITRADIISWVENKKGSMKEYEPKLHPGNPELLLSELYCAFEDKGYAVSLSQDDKKSIGYGNGILTFGTTVQASETGKAGSNAGAGIVVGGVVLAVLGVLLLFFSLIGIVLLILGVVLAGVGAALSGKRFVGGTIAVLLSGFTYQTTLKGNAETAYISSELRIIVGAIPGEKAEKTKEDFSEICGVVKSFLS
jgi:hypothetical protein